MKGTIKKLICAGFVACGLASCADTDMYEISASKPRHIEEYEYLKQYGPLKSYVDRVKYPNFKLGCALEAADFNNKSLVYSLQVANFDEVVTGNAFKYASCVDDNGNMDFGTVEDFVANAVEAGQNIYGHTLAWHAQQRPKYLNKLLVGTDEAKHDTLVWAMEQWISGIMAACKGNVHAWDVVNEAISGGDNDGDGIFDLQHGSATNKTDFFWQDYMGDLEYVRQAVRLARTYGPEDIKLFVNDYNLESDWDNNGKVKSLIAWIKLWEADGVTKIDGIGSQMHISCYANAQTQESKKKAITNMLKLMAESGKLCRISELDMGYVDADGNSVMTADMTEEQHHQMADLYKWVIEEYLKIIPAAQQWGICQWCSTDSPTNSGWRKGEPVGLWDLDYNRKHTYAGFADGLQGK